MEFTLNYNIPDQGYAILQYVDVDPVNRIINKLEAYKRAIKEAYADRENEDYFKGYIAYHKLMYVQESLIGEGNIDGSTTTQQLEGFLRHPDDSRISIKVNNFNKAMNDLFQNCWFADGPSQLPIESFTPEFIQNIHKQVAADLVDSPGVYRENDSGPSKERWTYLSPHQISDCLEDLCKFIRCEIIKEQSDLSLQNNCIVSRVKIVATFLANFLQIHPFTNGNGRVARLVISWLMSDMFIVPVPLYSCLSS